MTSTRTATHRTSPTRTSYSTDTINVGTGNVQLSGADPTATVDVTIEPGTQIYGASGSASAFVITRGSTVDIQGTADAPVIMGAVAVDGSNMPTEDIRDLTGRGNWGGLVLSGFGVENAGDTNGELTTEAAPTNEERWFGGDDNADDSGQVQYVVIAESGFEFRPDEEVQGLTWRRSARTPPSTTCRSSAPRTTASSGSAACPT
ncbi:MAG: hypothetical protein U5K33_08005 [Halofilum sp. (in: g-proteobacteria)]|nr:hypothetical protein [Halofilum sp. (in: g-proteobacteria)]